MIRREIHVAMRMRQNKIWNEEVRVTVTCSDATYAVLQANQIRATVDLTGLGADKEMKRNVEVSAPPGVTVVSVDPQKVGIIAPPPTH